MCVLPQLPVNKYKILWIRSYIQCGYIVPTLSSIWWSNKIHNKSVIIWAYIQIFLSNIPKYATRRGSLYWKNNYDDPDNLYCF